MSIKKSSAFQRHPNVFGYKGNQIFFKHPVRQKIYELFLTGKSFSVIDLSQLLHIPDPRSHIRFIRNEGVRISDYWQKSEFSHYKIYFLHSERGGTSG